MAPKESDTYADPLDGQDVSKTDSWPTPKRGGKNRRYGVFMGGGTFNANHELKKKALFKTSFQVRGPRAMQSAQKVLFELKTDETKIKFDGKLEIPKDSVLLGKELDKVEFLRELKAQSIGSVWNTSSPCLSEIK